MKNVMLVNLVDYPLIAIDELISRAMPNPWSRPLLCRNAKKINCDICLFVKIWSNA